MFFGYGIEPCPPRHLFSSTVEISNRKGTPKKSRYILRETINQVEIPQWYLESSISKILSLNLNAKKTKKFIITKWIKANIFKKTGSR